MKYGSMLGSGHRIWISTALVGIGIISGWFANELIMQSEISSELDKSLNSCNFAYKKVKSNLLPGENIIPVHDALNVPDGMRFMKLGLEFNQDISVDDISSSAKFKHNIWNRFDHLCVLKDLNRSVKDAYIVTFSEIGSKKFAKITYSGNYPSVMQEFTLVSEKTK